MTSYKQRIATVAPPTLQKQLEVLAAARTLLGQEDEAARWRRAEIAALRREYGELVQMVQELWRQYDPRLRSHVIRYNPDQPRVPAGSPHGGEWTSGDLSGSAIDAGAPAIAAPPGSQRGPQYAQADPGTRTDAMDDGGNVSAAAAQQNPNFLHDAYNAIADGVAHIFRRTRDFPPISANQIPADSPKRPVPFLDSFGQPIRDDQDNQLVRPFDLPPEAYAQSGLSAGSFALSEQIKTFRQMLEQEQSDPHADGQGGSALGGLAAIIGIMLLPFLHGGSFDAERTDSNYIREYRHYTSIALGIFMAAAGVSEEDMLWIADSYASSSSQFGGNEKMDDRYTHSAQQDIQDNLRGYELYKSGRIRPEN